MINGVIYAHLGPILYHSEPSHVTYSPNQFFGWDFFCRFLQQDSSKYVACSVLVVTTSLFELEEHKYANQNA